MVIVLLAVLLVLVVARALPDLARLRRFDWLHAWQQQLRQHGNPDLAIVFEVGLPVLVVGLIQYGLHDLLFGLAGLAFGVFVLFYSWGPRDLERDAEAIDKAPDSERRLAAAQMLRAEMPPEPVAFAAEPLVEATFNAALKRWFGVLFWFALLGPAGALLYRLAQLLAYAPEFSTQTPDAQRERARRLALILDWMPAQLMALSLALASNFDAVFKTWHDYHAAHGRGYFCLDLGFLPAIARASVDADVTAGDGYAQDTHNPLVALDDAMVLVRRVLVVWITVIALIVLAGWFG
ncbi:MAG TPA: beta-lactamase induction protein [Rudaea sp.]